MLIHSFFIPGLAIYSFLLFDEQSKKGVLIDPTTQIESYLSFASAQKIEISHILETHVHADFLSGAFELKSALGGKPLIYCSAMGGEKWLPAYVDKPVYDGDQISMGTFCLKAWHTPGHTEEHLIWLVYDEKRNANVPELAFTGDLLFVGSVGRPDLAGAAVQESLIRALYNTLFNRMQTLPDFLEIFPSHGAGSLCGKKIDVKSSSTWGYEKLCNPCLKKQEFEKWRTCLLENLPAPPDYFFRMKQRNLLAHPLKSSDPLPQMRQLRERDNISLVDTRSPEAFAAAHIPGSINLPFSAPEFPLWAGMVLPPDQEIFLILNQPQELYPVMKALRLIGMDQIQGYNLFSSLEEDEKISSAPMLEISALQQKQEAFYILDVRTPLEWQSGHLPGSHSVELALLPQSLKQLPKNKTIAVVCRSGNRSSVAVSYLKKHGFDSVQVVQGGIKAWQRVTGHANDKAQR